MDIAKIRKKLKQGGGSKKHKGSGEKKEPPPSALGDDSASGGEETSEKIESLPVDAGLPEDSTPSVEAPSVPVTFDDDEEEHVPVVEFLGFKVFGQMYAFRVDDVQEILRSQAITPVPATASFVSGITSLRGTIIPVVDMGRRFIIDKEYHHGNKAKIVVLNGPKGSIGVLIDGTVKVLTIAVTSVDESPEGLSEEEMRFISGVVRDKDDLVFIINVEELFNFSGKVEAR